MPHTVSLLFGALNTLLLVVLSANVSRLRGTEGVFGKQEAGDNRLHRAVRAHGNLSETVALHLALLLTLEVGGASTNSLMILGGLYFGCRVLHAVGMLAKSKIQAVGAVGNLLALAAQAVYALMLYVR